MGRAPIAITSRMMPPTPVAAPWYGSIAEGWLCDSILKTAAQPSPMLTAPAFSPGPWITAGPVEGRRRRSAFELLYEQCSDQSTPSMPSSTSFGALFRCSTMALYSSGWERLLEAFPQPQNFLSRPQHLQGHLFHPPEQHQAVGNAELRLQTRLGVRH